MQHVLWVLCTTISYRSMELNEATLQSLGFPLMKALEKKQRCWLSLQQNNHLSELREFKSERSDEMCSKSLRISYSEWFCILLVSAWPMRRILLSSASSSLWRMRMWLLIDKVCLGFGVNLMRCAFFV